MSSLHSEQSTNLLSGMVQGVKGVVEMVEFKLTMDRSTGVESVFWESSSEADGKTTAADITGKLLVEVTVAVKAVAGWDTRPGEDVTGIELVVKYFEESNDISAVGLAEELVVALKPA